MAKYTNNRRKNCATSHLDKIPGATYVSARPIIPHLRVVVKHEFLFIFVQKNEKIPSFLGIFVHFV